LTKTLTSGAWKLLPEARSRIFTQVDAVIREFICVQGIGLVGIRHVIASERGDARLHGAQTGR